MPEETALIPAGVDLQPEPAAKPEITFGRKKKRYAKEGDDPLDRMIARRRADAILTLKLEGRKPREIAQELHIPVRSIYWALYQLRQQGHLEAAKEVSDEINLHIRPMISERLAERLEDPNVSQELLIEAAKGTGIFVNHQKISSVGATVQQALVVKFELPEGASMPTAIGEIHSAPIEGEIVGKTAI